MAAARPFRFEQQADPFGWHAQADGRLCLGLFVETGRIRDKDGCRLRSGLRRVVELSQAEVRLTPGNNVILGNIAPGQQAEITRLLAEHGVDLKNQGSLLRRASMACVALPTCGLALAESERYLPDLISQFETVLAEVGLANEEIIIRMTGCPNGCARPYMAEIGLVGKGPGRYQVYLGGNEGGTRLNRLHNDNVKAQDIIPELRPLLARFATERLAGERFGDWCARVLWTSEPIAAAATPNT